MSPSSPTRTRLTVFGATGPSANAALVHALKASIHINALVRTPSKLTSQLLSQGISQDTIDAYLEITPGDVKDLASVKKALLVHGRPATQILFGIGMNDSELFSLQTLPAHTICHDGMQTVVQALRELNHGEKPRLVAISNRAINTTGPRDYPLLQIPIYWIIVARAARDKAAMEKIVVDAEAEGLLEYTIVRPSILSSGEELGMERISVGTEREPAVGYSIGKTDLGLWIAEEVVKAGGGRWRNEKVGVTY